MAVLFLITSTQAGELKLVGSAMAEFSIFKIDVYQISYYKGKDKERMILDYKRDVKKKYSIMGWEEGLEPILKANPDYKDKYNWIIKQVRDLKEGDIYIIDRNGEEVTMKKNNIVIGTIKDKIIASLVFKPWIGEKPVDKKLKKKLLGK